MTISRAGVLGAGSALAISAAYAPFAGAAVTYGKPENPNLRLGIPLDATSYLPLYVAQAAGTWKDAGLNVQLLAFRGDADSAQALAGGSIDVACGSLSGLVDLINAGQSTIGFYAGFNLADFSWYAQPSIKSWNDVRGKTFGISTLGSTTDALTRYVLRKHNIDPERDAHLLSVGNNTNQYQALKSGRTNVAMVSPPATWQAEADGFTLLGTQQSEVAKFWPEHLYSAKKEYIAANRNTLAAMLRGHVAGIRKARADKAFAVQVYVDKLKYTPELAARSYDEVISSFDEHGHLPERAMSVYWQIAKSIGDAKGAMPENTILDHQFINTFSAWAPK